MFHSLIEDMHNKFVISLCQLIWSSQKPIFILTSNLINEEEVIAN